MQYLSRFTSATIENRTYMTDLLVTPGHPMYKAVVGKIIRWNETILALGQLAKLPDAILAT